MRSILCVVIVAVLALAAAPAHATIAAPPPPSNALPADISANVTIDQGGQILHGYLYHDYTGHRTYLAIQELAQTTFTFQPFGLTTTYAYTITTSGCTCVVTPQSKIEPYFAQLATAAKTSKSCGTGGTLWENTDFSQLDVAPHQQFCLSDSGAVISAGTATTTYTFSNLQLGRTAPFPTEPLASMVQQCNGACL